MIKAYLNYLDPIVTIHRRPNCDLAKVGPEKNIRHVLIDSDSLSKELARFRNNKYRLSSEPGMCDIWLILDFQDSEFEMALVSHLKRVVGLLSSPIKDCELQVHC